MLKNFAWKAFENTGDISTYILLKEIEEKNRLIEETSMTKEEVAISSVLQNE
ncbi:UNVERIFIED_CONTAM: YqzL-like protein [Acetivibrio alkalicellulosi]